MCRKFGNGECSFGDQCWYKHTAIEDKKETTENYNDLIQRLFIMMENFAAKLEVLETRTWTKQWHKIFETNENRIWQIFQKYAKE